MSEQVTREQVLEATKEVEHPEIAVPLMGLGMILDVKVEGDTATVAMALPMMGIPEVVRHMLVESIRQPIEALGLKMQVDFFEMTPEARERFFILSRANWKGSV